MVVKCEALKVEWVLKVEAAMVWVIFLEDTSGYFDNLASYLSRYQSLGVTQKGGEP